LRAVCVLHSEQCDGRSSQLHNPIKACLADDGLIVCGVCWVDALVGVYLLACVRASLLYQHACSCLPRSLLWAACVSMCEHVCPLCRLLRARPVQRRTGARDSVDSFVVGGGHVACWCTSRPRGLKLQCPQQCGKPHGGCSRIKGTCTLHSCKPAQLSSAAVVRFPKLSLISLPHLLHPGAEWQSAGVLPGGSVSLRSCFRLSLLLCVVLCICGSCGRSLGQGRVVGLQAGY
jgi:hypothetical protein